MFEFMKYKPGRQCFILLLSGLLLLAIISCQNSLAPESSAQIALEIKLAASQGYRNASTLTTITRVVVTVSTGVEESYTELAVKELTVSGRSAQGTVSVSIGEDRTFSVSAYDPNENIQYHGNTTIDITEKTFTVEIGLEPIPPDRPTLSYDSQTRIFNWTESLALDFAAYAMYRANSPGVTLSSDLIYTTAAVDSTFHVDNESLPEGDYYYRVFVVDTEGLVSEGSNEIKVTIIN